MVKLERVSVQEQEENFAPIQTVAQASRMELFLRKIGLATLTMLGIGYVLVNVPLILLMGNALTAIPINSQANINAIAGRMLFLTASIIASALGALFIFGAVKFYERSQTKGTVFLGVFLGCFYLLSLGVGAMLMQPDINLTTVILVFATVVVAVSTAIHTSPNTRFRLGGSVLGIAGGVTLAFSLLNFRALDLVFDWGIPFTGPFMSLTVLESAAVVLGSVAACANSLLDQQPEERQFTHVSILLVALVYGIGTFIGSFVLAMSFWDLVWKSPWVGPLYGISDSIMSTVVFWSASLVLMIISGILLVASACLGLVHEAREFSQF